MHPPPVRTRTYLTAASGQLETKRKCRGGPLLVHLWRRIASCAALGSLAWRCAAGVPLTMCPKLHQPARCALKFAEIRPRPPTHTPQILPKNTKAPRRAGLSF
ncbi:hypothetical protein QOZ94_000355 [Xanthobacter agilis]|uniref:Uncharacterized protein n=1 Tax=Xanthobacter agilis TaxID=47492 RepID=A0ABU0L8Y0_XANAG|nr:hypothetical protein [Xanthobacter agilis]